MSDTSVALGATSVAVRLLPALAIAVGIVGVVVATSPAALIGGGLLIGCALVLELAGWSMATRAHASSLGTAALLGAVVGGLGLAGMALLDAPAGRDGVAALRPGR